jgi:hypothetical protein
MFNWFNAKDAQSFGSSLANFYMQRVPFESPFSEKKFAVKTQDTLKKMQLQVQQFKQQHTLNMYQKAKLGNAFKWALRDGGYDNQYVDEITEWLIVQF